MEQDDTNDTLPFVTIATCTRNVIRHLGLEKQQQKHGNDEAKRRDERHRYIEKSAAEIRRFEQRARGIVAHRPRRKRE